MSQATTKLSRREFLKQSAIATASIAAGMHAMPAFGTKKSTPSGIQQKVVIIGIDGMDPFLSERMMLQGLLPNFDRLRKRGGYRMLGTSVPPQSPVAWSNFINGADPGSHGIFDFIHRNPDRQCAPFFSVAETVAGDGFLTFGDYKLQLDFWPFNHKPPETILRRQGTPFWYYLDKAGIKSVFYDLPANYPASPSIYGNHKCLSGLGTPDLLGTYGTYQFFAEDLPESSMNEGGGKRVRLNFENETAKTRLIGPSNSFLVNPEPTGIDLMIHRDRKANAVAIEFQGKKILLEEGQWSHWHELSFSMDTPAWMPDKQVSGICRFYLQSVEPFCRLYVSPINANPEDPAIKLTEPEGFIEQISKNLGKFYTTGFQEDHKALSNGIFSENEFIAQAEIVLKERLKLLDYAIDNYDDGLLFFYFSSTDLQSHMLWWDSDEKHPVRTPDEARHYFSFIKKLYQRMDAVLDTVLKKFDKDTLVLVMSDHGFATFKRQFNLNRWLLENRYLGPSNATSLFSDVDWDRTKAYGLGINSLYINQQGREKYGIVKEGQEREDLITELVTKLQNVRDTNGHPVIRTVHRTDREYSGNAVKFAPDLVIGYYRSYRASWSTCLGGMSEDVLSENNSAWSADHCADVREVPGVLFSNRPIVKSSISLTDVAPSLLASFGVPVPRQMTGKNILKA